MSYTIRPLDASTWAAFAELVERNNGIFGGCWCIGYHPECGQKGISYRAVKQDRVRTGRAHAALVLDEDGAAQGRCQYGSPRLATLCSWNPPARMAGRRDGLAVCCPAVWLPGRSSSRLSSSRAPPGTGTALRAILSVRLLSGHAAGSRPRTSP